MNRVSTFGAQNAAIQQLMKQQSQMAHTQLQLSTMRKLNTAKDNPVAAGVAIALQRAEAEFVRFGENSDVLMNRLNLEETALTSVTDILARMREITVQANSGIQTAETRKAFVAELQHLKESLLAQANSTDGQGRYLFGGSQDATLPFSLGAGTVHYHGDQSVRRIEIAPGVTVGDADAGSEVFMRIRTGSAGVAARPEPGNTGTAVLKSSGFADPAAWDNDQYRIEFAGGNYEVFNGAGASVGTGTFVAGTAIVFAGYQVSLDGTPADGDAFTVGPAPSQSVFDILDDLVAALAIPGQPASSVASMQNAFYAVLEDLGQAESHIIDMRASTGARLAALDRGGNEREAQLLSTRTTLSSLRDLDYAEAVSRLTREMASMEAAQLSYQRIQSMSLFALLR